MIHFLQIDVGVCRMVQDLMVQTTEELGADVVLVSEQHYNASEDTG